MWKHWYYLNQHKGHNSLQLFQPILKIYYMRQKILFKSFFYSPKPPKVQKYLGVIFKPLKRIFICMLPLGENVFIIFLWYLGSKCGSSHDISKKIKVCDAYCQRFCQKTAKTAIFKQFDVFRQVFKDFSGYTHSQCEYILFDTMALEKYNDIF